jgi:hypothetical protein
MMDRVAFMHGLCGGFVCSFKYKGNNLTYGGFAMW